ncbi:hypothetical protein EVAR_63036_1 [Eumeta japonica]|uniref:Uncharacterized protein n=1 Tax=Eumeta variegata TaxID=151549 RepID=A0A4C1Z1V8_EUMVA|nr:hypothetical protein EVAR_63036_1 [Eumeta japonica]
MSISISFLLSTDSATVPDFDPSHAPHSDSGATLGFDHGPVLNISFGFGSRFCPTLNFDLSIDHVLILFVVGIGGRGEQRRGLDDDGRGRGRRAVHHRVEPAQRMSAPARPADPNTAQCALTRCGRRRCTPPCARSRRPRGGVGALDGVAVAHLLLRLVVASGRPPPSTSTCQGTPAHSGRSVSARLHVVTTRQVILTISSW